MIHDYQQFKKLTRSKSEQTRFEFENLLLIKRLFIKRLLSKCLIKRLYLRLVLILLWVRDAVCIISLRIYIGTISYSVSVFFTYDGIWIETVLLLDLREKNSGYHQYRRARPQISFSTNMKDISCFTWYMQIIK